MSLWGGWLPFIGWRVINVDNDGAPSEFEHTHWEADALGFEWLNIGVIFYVGKVRPRK